MNGTTATLNNNYHHAYMTTNATIDITWGKYEYAREYSLSDVSINSNSGEMIMASIGNDANGSKKLYDALLTELGDEDDADESWGYIHGAPTRFRRFGVDVEITITGSTRTRISCRIK